jgi:hypothetical protein
MNFKDTTYATMYDNAAEIPDDIVVHNAWATSNILQNPQQFPKADFASVQRDADFLFLECGTRLLKPHSAVNSDGSLCSCTGTRT